MGRNSLEERVGPTITWEGKSVFTQRHHHLINIYTSFFKVHSAGATELFSTLGWSTPVPLCNLSFALLNKVLLKVSTSQLNSSLGEDKS